jgi:hypothetical protein
MKFTLFTPPIGKKREGGSPIGSTYQYIVGYRCSLPTSREQCRAKTESGRGDKRDERDRLSARSGGKNEKTRSNPNGPTGQNAANNSYLAMRGVCKLRRKMHIIYNINIPRILIITRKFSNVNESFLTFIFFYPVSFAFSHTVAELR